MDNEKVSKMIITIGAIAETLGEFVKSLMSNGFTREEANRLCNTYLQAMIIDAKGEKN